LFVVIRQLCADGSLFVVIRQLCADGSLFVMTGRSFTARHYS
jgi:hypothetical protein